MGGTRGPRGAPAVGVTEGCTSATRVRPSYQNGVADQAGQQVAEREGGGVGVRAPAERE